MALFRVVANKTRNIFGWTSNSQIPTFYVDAFSAGEAMEKAKMVLSEGENTKVEFFITVGCADLTENNFLSNFNVGEVMRPPA